MSLRAALTVLLCLALLARAGMAFGFATPPAAEAAAPNGVAAMATDCHGNPLPAPAPADPDPVAWTCLDCDCGCLAVALPAATASGGVHPRPDGPRPDLRDGRDQACATPQIRPPIAA
ncbi:MAG: hypothetical protein KF823_13010 [Xanthomonadales bacterium]|nr:hypothetical protein [Xanthomonadales bacterium]